MVEYDEDAYWLQLRFYQQISQNNMCSIGPEPYAEVICNQFYLHSRGVPKKIELVKFCLIIGLNSELFLINMLLLSFPQFSFAMAASLHEVANTHTIFAKLRPSPS